MFLTLSAYQRLLISHKVSVVIMKKYTQISSGAVVNMSDDWYDIADLEHFWIRRRLRVFERLCPWFKNFSAQSAEVGCGQGTWQRQVELNYGKKVDGFDLNEYALKSNICCESELFCYNIHDKAERFFQKYQTIFMFDVIEHIDDEKEFIKAALFHLKPGGRLIVNVPASMGLYSEYDTAVGHLRRYSIHDMAALEKALELDIESVTYWGLSLYPVLIIRKMLMKNVDKKSIIKKGFEPPGKLMNKLLMYYSKLEIIPQQLCGTSVMAVFKKI